jgi:hypothetical protein
MYLLRSSSTSVYLLALVRSSLCPSPLSLARVIGLCEHAEAPLLSFNMPGMMGRSNHRRQGCALNDINMWENFEYSDHEWLYRRTCRS